MATQTKLPPPAGNGVITGPSKGVVGGNRKKQKRRAKQAAKQSTQPPLAPGATGDPADIEYDEEPLAYDEDDYDYSDAEPEHYHDQHAHFRGHANGHTFEQPTTGKKKNKKKKAGGYDTGMLLPNPPPPPPGSLRSAPKGATNSHIWNTSTQQERQNIKDFWLSLSEDDRKALLKIEKEAVLKKMKQQQKHSCSCTVCGRKRTAIEEELEVLYEGYYEELEQYAHHDHPPLPATDAIVPRPLQHRHSHPLANPPPPMPHHRTSHVHEHLDEDDLSEGEDYISEEEEEEESDEEPEAELVNARGYPVDSFFNFGAHLTVKGILTPWEDKLSGLLKGSADNLLTVADDLLKNDGRKFIEMMEQLAERRMQRETQSRYDADNHSGFPPNDSEYSHEDPMAGDEFDDEDASWGGSGYEDDEDLEDEDEMVKTKRAQVIQRTLLMLFHQGDLSEEQRMQEGRRMFQIFAARMFEQRVLTAYREKVAAERQRKLLEEIDDEDKLQAQREAKRQRDAQKKKDKKKQQQAAKAEEKAKRDAEKAEEEARLQQAEEKKLEEQRRKKEEQRKKREEEKRRQDEERARKEAEKLQRQQEEQQRREEAERKAREQRTAEKARKEEARKREREEREAREKEARERKAQEDREKKGREAKSHADRAAKDREKASPHVAHPPQIVKRPSQAGAVAIPGVFPRQMPSGVASPHTSIAMPAIPKAPMPTRPGQPSHQGSHASSPKQTQSQISSAASKSSSPSSIGPPGFVQPKTIMQKAASQQAVQPPPLPMPATSPSNPAPLQTPPGMSHVPPHAGNFGGMQSMGFQAFPGPHGAGVHNNMAQRGPFPMMGHQGPPMGVPNRMSFPGMNGMPGPPPGMMGPTPGRAMGFPFDAPGQNQPPPGFGQPLPQLNRTSSIGHPQAAPVGDIQRSGISPHHRQLSGGDMGGLDNATNLPIQRPAPIQRPSSVKPHDESDVDDISKHLGSSALLDDSDEPLPSKLADARHPSNAGSTGRNIPGAGIAQIGGFGAPGSGFGTPGSSWNTPSLPFGQGPGLGQPGWGSLPKTGMSSWSHLPPAPFGTNGAFGNIGAPPVHHRPTGIHNRPLTIRLAICHACKQLSAGSRGEGDGYHNVDVLLRQIELNRPMLDSPPTLREIEEICETEGDNQNGGGELSVRKTDALGTLAVMWDAGVGTPDQGRGHHIAGLGEIGSPMPSKTTPAVGFGAPGMGRAPGAGAYSGLSAVGSGGS